LVENTTGKILMEIDEKFFRPLEVDYLKGNSSKIAKELGWKAKQGVENIIEGMI